MADKKLKIIIEAVDKASKELKKIQDETGELHINLKKVATAAGAMGVAVGAATVAIAKTSIQAASEIEQFRVAFQTLVGDVQQGNRAFEALQEFAIKTPFDFKEVAEGSKRLLAMGTAVEDLIPTFSMLGDVAGGVGIEKLPQLILAFGQIQAKGRLMGSELRQLTEAGFNLADALGITNAELEDMISRGEISFEDVKQGFINVTEEGGRFHGLMQAQSKTTAGQMQALQESTYLLKAALGDALLPAVTTLIEAITPLVLRFTEWAKQNPELVATIFAIGAVLGVLGAIMLTLTAITFVLGATIGGIAVPILAVAGLIISVLIAAIVFLIKNWDLLKANIESIWIQIQYVIRTAIDNIKSAIETWFGNLKAQFSQSLDSIKNKVSGWVGSITGFFDTIIGKIRDAIGALKDFLGLNSKAGGESYSHYQHGGTIPGAFNQPVPIIAHGGERIIPKTGTDVNTGGGGGVTLNLTIQGDVNSEDMLDRIVDSVKSALGRDNELAAQGVSV